METALVLRVPEAEGLVSTWRLKYDPSAVHGMPAHITVLFPFRPLDSIDEACVARLGSIFAASGPLRLTLSHTARFPGALWLAPEPAEPIARLTNTLAAAFPDCPPYGGAFPDPIPHLTVAIGEEPLLEGIASQLAGALAAPIRSHVTECTLFARQPEGWREARRFPLSGASQA